MSSAKILAMLLVFIVPSLAGAVEYACTVTKKWDLEKASTKERLAEWNFTVMIEEYTDGAFLTRCSYSTSDAKEMCDRYVVDRIEIDERAALKKYYVFASHFDVQLFSDIRMLENNGRGTLATGQCRVMSP